MKKLFATISIFLLLPIVAAVAGCNTLSNDDWTEVQSITYTTESGTTTLTSECEWSYDSVEIEPSEYFNAPVEQQIPRSDLIIKIETGRKNFINHMDEKRGKTYYTPYLISVGNYSYEKLTFTFYTLNYVKVKFVSDSILGINFKGEQKRVNTLSYDVTYFTN